VKQLMVLAGSSIDSAVVWFIETVFSNLPPDEISCRTSLFRSCNRDYTNLLDSSAFRSRRFRERRG